MLPTGLVPLVDPEELDGGGDDEADGTDGCGAATPCVTPLAVELAPWSLLAGADDSAAWG